MGEIAEDAVEGLSCSLCDIYFKKAHGYPVACINCWNDTIRTLTKDDEVARNKNNNIIMINGLQKAIRKEVL